MRSLKLPSVPTAFAVGIYVPIVLFFKWGIVFSWSMFWFVLGAVIGLVLLDVTDTLFPDASRLIHGMAGVATITVAAFFVVTSSQSIVGTGLVLSLLLRIVSEQVFEYTTTGQIASWFVGKHTQFTHQGVIIITGLLLILFSYLFITLP